MFLVIIFNLIEPTGVCVADFRTQVTDFLILLESDLFYKKNVTAKKNTSIVLINR